MHHHRHQRRCRRRRRQQEEPERELAMQKHKKLFFIPIHENGKLNKKRAPSIL